MRTNIWFRGGCS